MKHSVLIYFINIPYRKVPQNSNRSYFYSTD